jgi:hypothetical protein
MNNFQKIVKYGLGPVIVTYTLGILASLSIKVVGNIHGLFSPKVHTQEQLEDIVAQERERLDMDKNIFIESRLVPYTEGKARIIDNHYVIEVGGYSATEAVVRHELYHVFDGHQDHPTNTLVNLFWEEPRTDLYQMFRLDL